MFHQESIEVVKRKIKCSRKNATNLNIKDQTWQEEKFTKSVFSNGGNQSPIPIISK